MDSDSTFGIAQANPRYRSQKRKNEDDDPAASSKRRKKGEKNVPLCDLSADDFVDKLELFSGPKASVQVEGKEFQISKKFLCHYSSYFKAALAGNFQEGMKQKVTLHEFEASTFSLVVQWLHQGCIKIPSNESELESLRRAVRSARLRFIKNPHRMDLQALLDDAASKLESEEDRCKKSTVENCIKFLSLADYLALIGPFDSVVDMVKNIFKTDPAYFKSVHIHLVVDLPPHHAIRVLIIEMAAQQYTKYLLDQVPKFMFEKELHDLPAFKQELDAKFAALFSNRGAFGQRKPIFFEIASLLGKEDYKITVKKYINGR